MTTCRPRNCRPVRRPANCCSGDCRQGRDCPNRGISDESVYAAGLIAAWSMTAIAAAAGVAHLVARMGWI